MHKIVRLQSRKYQGCGTFKDCEHGGIHLTADNPSERLRNWFAFYCRDKRGTADLVADCTVSPAPEYRSYKIINLLSFYR